MDKIDYKQYKLGTKLSPIDERDYKISKLLSKVQSFPKSFSLDISKLKIQDQGTINECCSESLCYCSSINTLDGAATLFSKGWIYGNRKASDYLGEGMYAREALQNLVDDGVVLEEDFSVQEEYPFIYNYVQSVRNGLLPKANLHKILAYAQVESSDDIKLSLINGHPVSIAIPVFDSYYMVGNDGVVGVPDQSVEPYGYHQNVICGWREDGTWITINSWSENWGDKGICYLPPVYPISEAWSVIGIDKPIVVPPVVKTYWKCQIGAFSNRENAQKLSDEISKKGIATCLMFVNGLWKVQCGCFAVKENSIAMRDKLIALGYKDAFIVMV